MGQGYKVHCRDCGYGISANLGVGFRFPMVYQETMEAARAGQYGEEIRRFLEEHPEGTLNTETVLLQCTGCGHLECGPDLSMYVRRPDAPVGKKGRWSVEFPYEGAEYVSPTELKKDGAYEFVGRGHSCRECGKPMKPISASDLDRLLRENCYEPCRAGIPGPESGKPLWIENHIMWD